MLVPAPDYGWPFDWAFDNQARALRDAGAEVVAMPWTDVTRLDAVDLVLPLVAWGYHLRLPEWLAFLDRAEASGMPLANPAALLRWNSDKVYLTKLAGKGVPTVPTLAVDHLNEAALAAAHGVLGTDQLVIKPPVSAGAWGTFRLGPGDPVPGEMHGERMLIQPWLRSIQDEGEYSLLYFGGRYSHCVAKRPRIGDFRVQPDHGGSTEASAPPDGAFAVAEAALGVAPAATTYARIDLIRGDDGRLLLMEMELIEPALFLEGNAPAEQRFAEAVLATASAA